MDLDRRLRDDYTLDELLEAFASHHEQAQKQREQDIENWQKNYPDEPEPKWMKEDFSLSLALWQLCAEVNRLKKIEEHDRKCLKEFGDNLRKSESSKI